MDRLIGKIEKTPLREVWRHEAMHFTQWLAENLDVVGEAIGIDLSLVEREASAGDFRVDLLAEGVGCGTVIIENQLGKSDHDHLGKLLTYIAAFEAHTAVWIVGDPRPEHTKAAAWLNDSSPISVHLLRAEAIRIGQSPPALLLTPILGPSEVSKAIAREKQEQSEQGARRERFWAELLERAAPRTRLHSGRKPSDQNWLDKGAGRAGFLLTYVSRKSDWRVELYIDTGDAERNDSYFSILQENSTSIGSAYGAALEWQALHERRACRITTPWMPGGYGDDVSEWPAIHDSMIDAMVRLELALRPHLDRLPSPGELPSPITGGA